MAGKEKIFSQKVRQALKGAGCQCYPVETGQTVVGFPDLAVIGAGGVSFVELKSLPSVMLAEVVSKGREGPGQKAFARSLIKKSSYIWDGAVITSHSFLLAECMDGIALLVEEVEGSYPAACWEEMPSGVDLRDALRAWRIRCSPSRELEGCGMEAAVLACVGSYEDATGINVSMSYVPSIEGDVLDNKEKALEIARKVCDAGRLVLLTRAIKDNGDSLVPIEGDNGYVLMKGE